MISKTKDKNISLFIKKAIILVLGTVGSIVLFNFIVDPLQFYRKATRLAPVFSREQRLQNPGLAKNYDYNTIILGTSMTENFLPSYVDSKLGVKTLKLSMSGSSIMDQEMNFNMALKQGSLENVIWEMNYFSFMHDSVINQGNEDYSFPTYLYDDYLYNDYKYLLSQDVTKHSLRVLRYNYLDPTGIGNTSLEYLNNWGNDGYEYSEAMLMESYNNAMENIYFSDQDNWDLIRSNIDKYLLNNIKNNKDVNFILYYPPFSDLLLKYLEARNINDYNNFYKIRDYIKESTTGLNNVRIYDFQEDAEITSNYNNYKDMSHHSAEINEYIIDIISKDIK